MTEQSYKRKIVSHGRFSGKVVTAVSGIRRSVLDDVRALYLHHVTAVPASRDGCSCIT